MRHIDFVTQAAHFMNLPKLHQSVNRTPVTSTLKQILELLEGASDRGEAIPLHALIWTIDAMQHHIPTTEELNAALEQSPPYRIHREAQLVVLHPSANRTGEAITDNDIDLAMSFYHAMLSQNNSKKRNS